MNTKTDFHTIFRCIPIEGETTAELAQNYEDTINDLMHDPPSQYHEEAGRHLYMRPMEYSLGMIGDAYVANVTLVGTTNEPIQANVHKHHE